MYKIIPIIAILISLAFAEIDVDANIEYENFTVGERVLASALNMFSFYGLGSLIIMKDIEGAAVQLALAGSGVLLIAYNIITCDRFIHCGEDISFIAGFTLVSSSFIWSIFRPFYYNKPQNTTSNQNTGFNMAILPSKQGDLKTYLFYNVTF